MLRGTALSHYNIVRQLGTGGMGEVYLARDTRLDREVALKILPPEVATDTDRLRRFQQEARAAAALNHPNIAHTYEVGEESGTHFIAMEYVEGQGLDKWIEGGPRPLEEVLEVAVQAAEALGQAHAKGITHRDIKPANIMVARGGMVKVLDFGLAKVAAGGNTGAATQSVTSSGAVVGTLQYMSPEQALGQEIDPRSDIFSLGAVIYEMGTGRRAFEGTTAAAVFDAILNKTPRPPQEHNPKLTPGFGAVVLKALEKDRELRYQTVSDLRADLKRLQRDSSPAMAKPPEAARRAGRRLGWLAGGGALALLLASVALVVRQRSRPAPLLEAVPLTSFPGSESQPSFSPDGRQVAFTWNNGSDENWDLYVKVVGSGTPLRLTSTPANETSPAWSPDGRHIAFLRQGDVGSGFYLIPALGGLEQKVSEAASQRIGLESPYVAWSPDSAVLALADRASPDEPMAILLHTLATGERRKLTAPPAKWLGDSSPVFSPDGRTLAFVRTANYAVQDIYLAPVGGGEPRRLTSDNRRIYGMAWNQRDGRIVFSSSRGGSSRLWRIDPRGGAPERIIGVGENASVVALSPQGDRLAYTRSSIDTNIWRYAVQGSEAPVRLIASTRQEAGPQYSPDGRQIVYSSRSSGTSEIWVCDAEAANASQLTHFDGPATGSPSWSPDGRLIAFDSRPEGNPDIYLVSPQGGSPRRLTSEASAEVVPTFSRDGKWVYFASNRTGSYQLWKTPVEGGPQTQVTRGGGFRGLESTDGRSLYYAKSPNGPGLWRLRLPDGEEEPVLESLRGGFWAYWAVHGQGIYFLAREEGAGGARYFVRHLDGSSRRERLVKPVPRRPFNAGLSVSPDGKSFLYTQVDQSDTDILLVDGLR